MSKDIEKFDDFDFDDFDSGSGFGDPFKPKSNRQAIQDIPKNFLAGFKETAVSPGLLRDVMVKALPKGYGDALDVTGDMVSEGLNAYREVERELGPAVKGFKKAVKRAKPLVEPLLPKVISDKLDKLLQTEDDTKSAVVDATEAAITSGLAEIFGAQEQAQQARDQETEARETTREALADKRARGQQELLSTIATGISHLVGYQNNVGVKFQRKALELQYRQYYIARDQLELLKSQSLEHTSLLRSITQNTALPEIQKMEKSEQLKQAMSEKLFGKVADSFANYTRNFRRELTKNIANTVKTKGLQLAEGFRQGAMGVDMAAQGIEMSRDMGVNEVDFASQGFGSGAARWLGKKAATPVWGAIKAFGLEDKVKSGDRKLRYLLENDSGVLDAWARTQTEESNIPGWTALQNLIKMSVPTHSGIERLAGNDPDQLTKGAAFDNITRTSIIEVIPVLLSKILQSTESIRTYGPGPFSGGNAPQVDAQRWDYKKGEFASSKELQRRIRTSAVGTSDLTTFDRRTDDMLDLLVKDSDVEFSKDERQQLKVELLKRSESSKLFKPSDFLNTSSYGAGVSEDTARKFGDLLQKGFQLDAKGNVAPTEAAEEKEISINRLFKDLKYAYPSMGKEANFYANTGLRDLVTQSGLTRREGNTDVIDSGVLQRRFEAFLKGVPYDEEMDAVTQVQNSRGVVSNDTGLGGLLYADRRDRISDTPASTFNMGVRSAATAGVDSSAVESSSLLESAIRESSSKPEAIQQVQLLEELLELIQALPTGGLGGGDGGGGGGGGASRPGRLRRWGKGAALGTWGAIKGLYNAGATVRNKLLGATWGATKWAWGSLTGKSTADDVYLPGVADPVLSKWKMAAGQYFDKATGKVIQTFADIKGAVVDKDGNVVLSVEDAKRAILKNGKSLLGSLSSAFTRMVANPVLGMANMAKTLVTAQFKALGKGAQKLWRWNLSNVDICVKGEEPQVRLYAHLMRRGYYHDAKDISKTIYSFKDIVGGVLDNDGNIILTAEDLNKGLVTKDGKPLRTTTQKLLDGGKWALRGAKNLALKGWEKTKKAYGWAAGKVGSGVDWMKGKLRGTKLPDGLLNNSFNGQLGLSVGGGGDLASHQVSLLVRIHNLLIRGFQFDDTPLNPADFGSSGGVGVGSLVGKAKAVLSGTATKAKDALSRAKKTVKEMDRGQLVESVTAKLTALGVPASVIQKVKAVRFGKGKPAAGSEYDDPSTFGNKSSGRNRSKISQWQQHFLRKAEALKNDSDGLTLDDLKSLTVNKAKSLKDKVKDRWASEGERENSFLDIIKDRKERAKKGVTGFFSRQKEKAEGGNSWIGKLMMLLTGMSGALTGILSFGKGMFDSVKSIRNTVLAMQAAKGVADLAGGVDVPDGVDKDGKPKKTGGKPKGKMGRAWQATKTGGRMLGNATMQVAKWGLVKPVGWAIRGGVALAGLGLSGALAVLTSPVVLGAAAVAGVGYGLYKGYRWLKGELKPLARLRCAEYGGDPDDLGDWDKIRELEEKLKPFLKLSPTKPAELDNDLPYPELLGIFGIEIEESDREKAMQWANWFQYRFKPVYLTHITVLSQLQPGVLLADIDDKLVDSLKVPFATRVVFSAENAETPYSVAADPYGDTDSPLGRKQIDIELAAIEEQFGEAAQKEKAARKVDGSKASSAGSLGFVAGMREGMPVAGGQGSGVGVAPAQLKRRAGLLQTKQAATKYVAQSQASGAPLLKTSDTLNASFAGGRQRTIDDFAAVRLKTYGLIDLDVEKVNAVLALETEILEQVLVTPQGKATLYKDPEHYFTLFAGHFGVNPADKESKEQWLYWFAYRFTPVVLNYVAAVKKIDKNASLLEAWKNLGKQALYDTATAVSTTQVMVVDKMVSVWSIYANPFPLYTVNENPKSVEPHLNSLKADMGKQVYQTPAGKVLTEGPDGKRQVTDMYKLSGGMPDAFKPGNVSKLGKSGFGAGPLLNSTPMVPFMAGSGKGYNELPSPKGNGSLDAYRDLLTAAAQAAGVDPNMLFTMARLESSFNTNARASGSSAAGLFQFLASTWREQVDKHGATYGLPPGVQATDPKAAALMAAEYIKANREALEKRIGRQATATDIYAAHFLGAGGASKLLTTQPMQDATQVFPGPAKSNPAIFYDGNRPRSIGEVIAVLDRKVGAPYNPTSQTTPEIPVIASVDSEGQGLAQVAIGEVTPNARPTRPASNVSLLDSAAKSVVGTRKASVVQVSPSAAKGGFNSVSTTSTATKQLASVKALEKAETQKAATAVQQSKAASEKTQTHVKTAVDVLQESLTVQKAMDKTLTSIDKKIDRWLEYLDQPTPQYQKPEAPKVQTASAPPTKAPNPVVSTKRNV